MDSGFKTSTLFTVYEEIICSGHSIIYSELRVLTYSSRVIGYSEMRYTVGRVVLYKELSD